jgi:hypothetical protein
MEGPPVEPVYSKRSIINIFPCKLWNRTNIVLLLVYYKMFDEEGPLKVQNAIYSNNPYIGRVDANDIPPPHTVSSLVERMRAEENKAYGYSTELFETISSPKAFNIQKPLSLLSTDRPGSRPQDPLILKVVIKGYKAC